LCGSVFDEEKPILRRLAQTVHHSSADFGYVEESIEGTSRKGICRSYDRGYPQGEFKKAKGRPGFVGALLAPHEQPAYRTRYRCFPGGQGQGVRSPDDRAGGMVWIPGRTFRMGSDRHSSRGAEAARVAVGGF
jgi:formylglycine-generating enzyme required for sulfatase activity